MNGLHSPVGIGFLCFLSVFIFLCPQASRGSNSQSGVVDLIDWDAWTDLLSPWSSHDQLQFTEEELLAYFKNETPLPLKSAEGDKIENEVLDGSNSGSPPDGSLSFLKTSIDLPAPSLAGSSSILSSQSPTTTIASLPVTYVSSEKSMLSSSPLAEEFLAGYISNPNSFLGDNFLPQIPKSPSKGSRPLTPSAYTTGFSSTGSKNIKALKKQDYSPHLSSLSVSIFIGNLVDSIIHLRKEVELPDDITNLRNEDLRCFKPGTYSFLGKGFEVKGEVPLTMQLLNENIRNIITFDVRAFNETKTLLALRIGKAKAINFKSSKIRYIPPKRKDHLSNSEMDEVIRKANQNLNRVYFEGKQPPRKNPPPHIPPSFKVASRTNRVSHRYSPFGPRAK